MPDKHERMEIPHLSPSRKSGLIPELKLFGEIQKLVVSVLISLEMRSLVQQVPIARIEIGTIPFARRFADEAT
ncbi:hypothetical protein WI79_27750 [Burkholderia ubonensis]|nr:hypothetical protein WI79_27750 [Burkholderia ubonensis]